MKQGVYEMGPYFGGLREDEALVQPNELFDVNNLLIQEGELRTRKGQRFVTMASPLAPISANGDVHNYLLEAYDTTNGLSSSSSPIDQDTMYWGCRKTTVGFMTNEQCSFPFYGMVLHFNATQTALTVSWDYYDGSAWQDLNARIYNLYRPGGNFDDPWYFQLATYFAETAAQLIVFNKNGDEPLGDDDFFDDWSKLNVNSSGNTRWWLRMVRESGTYSSLTRATSDDISKPLIPVCPQALTVFPRSSGEQALAVSSPVLLRRGQTYGLTNPFKRWEAAANLWVSQRRGGSADAQSPAGMYPVLDLDESGSTDPVTDSLKDFDRLVPAGWSNYVGGSDTTPGLDNYVTRYRLRLPKERVIVIPETGRILATSRGGMYSVVTGTGGQDEIIPQDTAVDRHKKVIEEFPTRRSDRSNTYPDLASLRHLGRPTAIELYDGHVFAGYEDGTVRWSAGVPLEDFWFDNAFDRLLDGDSSTRITAMRQWSDYLVVFTTSSIWIGEPTGDALLANQVNNYRFRKVVSGVGTLNQQTIVEVDGSLVFLHRSGIYAWSGGTTATLLTDKIQRTFDEKLNVPALDYASMAYDQRNRQLWLACARTGSYWNDLVIVLDFQMQNAIFKLTGINAECLTYDRDNDAMYSVDKFGRVWQQNSGIADGYAGDLGIDCYLETGPINLYSEMVMRGVTAKFALRQWVGTQYALTPIVDDVEGTTDTFGIDQSTTAEPLGATDELVWGDASFSLATAAWVKHNLRRTPADPDANDGQYMRLKLALSSPVAGDVLSFLKGFLSGVSSEDRR